MTTPKIKICGLTTPETLEAAIAARADYFGLMFYAPSPRFASLGVARELTERAAGRIGKVGVYVDADDATLTETIAAAGLDALQFHGSESPERVAQARAQFGLPVWKVLSVAKAEDIARAQAYLGAADLILFDAKTPKGALQGGMGLKFDWSLLSAWKAPCPWGLAGGLSAENVAEAVRLTGAPLVDTSSGVESAPGVKDVAKIAAFCATARSA
ncbi:phosphoribosylanthranilate isomerase [Novosphingobium sp. B 225]|uniref:phosphoribosylanthranilate isomerase n=1 Tax=Novosphingobium sp. B 225 TaxID=1961849 RepID=UPI000B4A6AD0|nr:phosphoribosylanthranilate isomerase [Novosphingobium sp. B 225]